MWSSTSLEINMAIVETIKFQLQTGLQTVFTKECYETIVEKFDILDATCLKIVIVKLIGMRVSLLEYTILFSDYVG